MEFFKTQKEKLIISSSPFVHSGNSIRNAMGEVILSLVPVAVAACYFFGWDALLLMVTCIVSAVASEAVCQYVMGRKITINDFSAALTGLLLALCLPASLPLWMGAVGSFCAIVIGKQVFGGLGGNLFNPAHLGRAILLASFPKYMTHWTKPVSLATDAISSASLAADGITMATPLATLARCQGAWEVGKKVSESRLPDLWNMFCGNVAGSIGETCVPIIVLCGLFLIWRKHIDWRIPVVYIGTVGVIMTAYGYYINAVSIFPLYHLCSGGLMLGAFFMATDWVTSPVTVRGRIIYALGLGILTCLIRLRGSYPEGVCYSILIMNMFTTVIDEYVQNKPFGKGGGQNG